ncbi:hypothetical protein H6786_00900 [Candidatus Nomurabacteria bacterium]|nr:hypothetical protein [Candidatus Nomurabacteria bacterium]
MSKKVFNVVWVSTMLFIVLAFYSMEDVSWWWSLWPFSGLASWMVHMYQIFRWRETDPLEFNRVSRDWDGPDDTGGDLPIMLGFGPIVLVFEIAFLAHNWNDLKIRRSSQQSSGRAHSTKRCPECGSIMSYDDGVSSCHSCDVHVNSRCEQLDDAVRSIDMEALKKMMDEKGLSSITIPIR